MRNQPTLSDEITVLRSAIPGGLVFVAVMLLLRGYDGTVDALRQQVILFAHSFFGGEDGMMPLLVHTLPLAIAAAVAAFAIAAGWITFESVWSIVALAVIVIGGATVGGTLYGHVAGVSEAGSQMDRRTVATPGSTADTISASTVESTKVIAVAQTQMRSTESPVQQLANVDLTAVPDLSKSPPSAIEPLDILPKVGGVLGIIAMAINQLLAFVVAYQPRVFLAAVLAGAWTGWKWQHRLAFLPLMRR